MCQIALYTRMAILNVKNILKFALKIALVIEMAIWNVHYIIKHYK